MNGAICVITTYEQPPPAAIGLGVHPEVVCTPLSAAPYTVPTVVTNSFQVSIDAIPISAPSNAYSTMS